MKKFIIMMSCLLMTSCMHIYDWQTKYPDNYAEEIIEDFVEEQSGKDIDLTPFTGDERWQYFE